MFELPNLSIFLPNKFMHVKSCSTETANHINFNDQRKICDSNFIDYVIIYEILNSIVK